MDSHWPAWGWASSGSVYTLGSFGSHLASRTSLPSFALCALYVHSFIGSQCRFLELFPHMAPPLSSSASRHLNFPNLELCLLSSARPPCSRRGSPALCQRPGSTSRQKARETAKAHFIDFPCLGDQACATLFHCLKTVVSYLFPSFLIVHSGKASPVPVILSWLKVQSHSLLVTIACDYKVKERIKYAKLGWLPMY